MNWLIYVIVPSIASVGLGLILLLLFYAIRRKIGFSLGVWNYSIAMLIAGFVIVPNVFILGEKFLSFSVVLGLLFGILTFVVDKNLENGFLYDYKIVAQKQDGLITSDFSKKSTIFASASPTFKVESTRKHTAKITINPVKGANLYVIYFKNHGSKEFKFLAKTSSLKFKITGLASGVYYDFRIKACVDKNTASCSSPYSIKTRKIK